MLEIAVWCLVVTALLSYINERFIGLPTTIGVMTMALVLSLALIGLDFLGWSAPRRYEAAMMASIDFPEVLMRGILALLLFAGGLQVNLARLRRFALPILSLAVVGTVTTAALVAAAVWLLLPVVDVALPLAYCLVFGALISPTDPVAVGGILKSAGAPKELETIISGESLFNDAVGVVLFAMALALIKHKEIPDVGTALLLLLREGGGGIVLGLLLGEFLYRMLRTIQNYQVEVLLTLAVVMGGYFLADHLDVSGPLAMVVAGLVVGTRRRLHKLSHSTREHLHRFWELLDGVFNIMLFVLIGLEVVRIHFHAGLIAAAMLTILITLFARALSVAAPLTVLGRAFNLPAGSWHILTWAGLRGGVSVALALSLPAGSGRETVLALTYCVVVFSVLVQGLSVRPVTRQLLARQGGS